MNDLNKLGREIGKVLKETKQNSKKITKNQPHIERKLDTVSHEYNYKMEFPWTDANHAKLNLYFKPDNCCDCNTGAMGGQRQCYGYVSEFEGLAPYDGPLFPVSVPVEENYTGLLSDGLEHRALLSDITTIGINDSPWFGWYGYPFFYPWTNINSFYENPANRYGDFDVENSAIKVPTNGLYIIKYRNIITGQTTNNSKITLSIKHFHDGVWNKMVSRVFSIEKGNICWEVADTLYCAEYGKNGMFIIDVHLYANCYPIFGGDLVAGFIQAEDVLYFNPHTGPSENKLEATLIGVGWGAIKGYIKDSITGLGLEEVSVTLSFTGETVLTNILGYYYFNEITPGVHTITANGTSIGYNTISREVTVPFNDIVQADILLVD